MSKAKKAAALPNGSKSLEVGLLLRDTSKAVRILSQLQSMIFDSTEHRKSAFGVLVTG